MIELSCPQCQSDLEIDEGFRGGVCRCFNCGTLMTVPDDPASASPERLERPDAPAARRPDAPPSTRSGSASAAAPSPSRTTYQTASGKVVELSAQQIKNTPTARKRKNVRIATMTAIIVILVGLFAGVGFVAYKLFAPPPTIDADALRVEEYGYDPNVNPFTLAKPNFLGLPVTGSVVLMSDSSSSMRQSMELINEAVMASLKTLGPQNEALIIYWNEKNPASFPSKLTPVKDLDLVATRKWLDERFPSGGVVAAASFTRAIQEKPRQIILVLRQPPMPAELKAIGKAVDNAGVKLDVILLDSSSDELKKMAEDSDGRYIEMPLRQLQDWYRDRPAGN